MNLGKTITPHEGTSTTGNEKKIFYRQYNIGVTEIAETKP
jgi:hypothetical protein